MSLQIDLELSLVYMNILAIYFLPKFIFKLSVFCKQQ